MQTIGAYNLGMTESTSPLRHRFGMRFVELARRWRRALDSRLAVAGLTDATWAPLIHLHESGDGIHQKALAFRLGLDTSSIVRLLDILSARGLIERREDPHDRRAKHIFLTPQGHAEVREIRQVLTTIEQEMLADVTDDELAVISGALEKISTRAQSILDGQQENK